jgi:hypothetical protein
MIIGRIDRLKVLAVLHPTIAHDSLEGGSVRLIRIQRLQQLIPILDKRRTATVRSLP